MRVLVVKTSSLGDVIHTLPALTDASQAIPGIRFDWAVEENFAEIPKWHPAVDQVIPVAIRRWRKNPFASLRSPEWKHCKTQLTKRHYDCVIDAQGLLKSAWLARYVKAPRFGLDKNSVREPMAAWAYHHKIAVSKKRHAVERIRQLFAQSLGYPVPEIKGSYGLDKERFTCSGSQRKHVVFLHGTTRFAKYWPESYWLELSEKVCAKGFTVSLPWGNEEEKSRAERIAASNPAVEVLPKLNLQGVASVLAQARAVVAVDTGLGHLSAALDVPAISLYGPTSPALVGAYGERQVHLSAGGLPLPLGAQDVEPKEMAPLTPGVVWQALAPLLSSPPK